MYLNDRVSEGTSKFSEVKTKTKIHSKAGKKKKN